MAVPDGGDIGAQISAASSPMTRHLCSRGRLFQALTGDTQAGHPTVVASFSEDSRFSSCPGWQLLRRVG